MNFCFHLFFYDFIFSVIVVLLCSISTLKQCYSDTHTYIYIHIYMFVCIYMYICIYIYSFSLITLHHVPLQVTVYISVCCIVRCLSTPNAILFSTKHRPPVHLTPPCPTPWWPEFALHVLEFLFFVKSHLCLTLDSRYKWYRMVFVFLFLTYFT